jgi:integrase
LKEPEIRALWEAADPIAGQLLSLLLSGLDLPGILRLKAADFDLDQGSVRLRDDPRGSLLLTPAAIKLFRETSPLPVWINDDPSLEEVRARLAVLAVDAGLREPDQIDDRAIRHTYISYLVRQGLRLSEVHRVAGPISPTVMAQYRELSPPGPGKGVDQISPVYPLPQPAAA